MPTSQDLPQKPGTKQSEKLEEVENLQKRGFGQGGNKWEQEQDFFHSAPFTRDTDWKKKRDK